MKLLLQINKEQIDTIDLSEFSSLSPYIDLPAGQEHYKLLTFLAKQLPDGSKVADLGTLHGISALALALNPKIFVVSYDINDQYSRKYAFRSNVTYFLGNALLKVHDYVNSKIILLDLDPHDSIQETKVIATLASMNYKGLVICDDIYLNKEMKSFWSSILQKKYDITKYGHHSGTGLICFDETSIDVIIT